MSRHLFTFTAHELVPYIDWSYFFHAWGFKHSDMKTPSAQMLMKEAVELAKEDSKCRVRAIFALFDARGDGDNIELDMGTTLPFLRQQHSRNDIPNLCLSDFVSPLGDKIGLFATAIERSFEEEKYSNDPYQSMLKQTMSDRLAEAAATLLHLKVRTESALWGYAPNESLSVEELNREEYQGIRPAVGYPSLPDQSFIFIIDKLLNLKDIGIALTASGAMQPHASVCGLMLSHPAARYFAVGSVSDEQFEDYSQRRGITTAELKKFLIKNI